MTDLIKDILTSPEGSFGFVFGILALAFWLVYFVTHKITIINSNHNHLTESLKNNKEESQTKFVNVESKIDEIRKDIAFLRGFTESIQKTINDGYTQRHSPISLTPKGKSEVEEKGLDKIVEKNWHIIFPIIEKEVASKNPYDIQTYCMENVYVSPEKFFTADEVSYIKELAFKNGLALMTYTNMLAVLIRDKYFIEKGIAIEDIDKYDPTRK